MQIEPRQRLAAVVCAYGACGLLLFMALPVAHSENTPLLQEQSSERDDFHGEST